ncbi:MAG: hypothetical protein DRH89_01675 [Candidatus Cloacimonadota bacterium]|nr:MAG: hypothetical protein DRH89_01675 [Candidatus Cloacimonadota bacterium]
MKKIILLILLIAIHSFITATIIDSLNAALEEPDVNKGDIYIQLAEEYWNVNPDKSIEYATRALKYTETFEDEVKYINQLGIAYEYSGKYQKALNEYEKALKIAESNSYRNGIGLTLHNMAIAKLQLADYENALDFALRALNIFEEEDEDDYLTSTLNSLGNIYLQMDDTDQALHYYEMVYTIELEKGNEPEIAIILHNIALVHLERGEFDKALDNLECSLKSMEKSNDKFGMAFCYNNLSNIYISQDDFEKANEYNFKALEIFEEIDNLEGIANTCNLIGSIFLLMDQYKQAFDQFDRSLKLSKEMSLNDLISDNYQSLSNYYAAIGDYKQAFNYLELFTAKHDSIYSETTRKTIAELQTKYEIEKRNKEIELLKKDAENKDKIRNYLIYVVVLGIMVTMFLLNLYFEKLKDAKARQEISEKLQESEIRFRNLTENLKSAVFTFDVSGLFTYVNPATSKISGYTESELLKMKFYDIIHPVYKDMVSQRGFSRLQGEDIESTYELKIITKQGDIRWIQISSDRIVINNQILVLGSAIDITESKITSEKKEESEAKLRALFAAIKDVILVLDRTGKYLDIAPTNDELLYKPAQVLLGNYISNIFDKDMTEYFLEKIDECLQSNETISVEYSLNIKDHLYWFDGRISPMTENTVVMVVRDITDRTNATKKLIESENKYRNLVESIEEGMIITDKEMNFVFANKAAARLYGYSIEELMNMNVMDVILPEESDVIIEQNKIRSEGKSSHYENWNIRKDGTKILLKVSASPMLKEGEFAGTISLFSDITEIKAAEEKIKASLKEKDVMLQEIYHRVKNNMQVISSMLKLQSSHINKDNALEIFVNTQNRVKSMSLIHEKLYRSENLSHVDFNGYLKSLMKQLFISYTPLARNLAYHIDCSNVFLNIGTAIPCGLIVNEIVTNSIKHAFPDAKEGNIFISMHKNEAGTYSLVLSNDGINLPADYDLENSTSFGLQLVEILRHQLKADFNMNGDNGAKFTFTFKELKK